SAPACPMTPRHSLDATTRPRAGRLAATLVASAALHALVALLLVFDVAGIGGGLGLGVGPGLGIGAGGGAGLGAVRRRQIYSLEDIPQPEPPRDPTADATLHALLAPTAAEGVTVPPPARPAAVTPVVRFAPPARPLVADATGSMQNVIDDLKHHLDDLADTLQRLVPTARIGVVAYRDRDQDEVA